MSVEKIFIEYLLIVRDLKMEIIFFLKNLQFFWEEDMYLMIMYMIIVFMEVSIKC